MRRLIAVAALPAACLSVASPRPGAAQPARPSVRAALTARTPATARPRTLRLALTVTPGWHIGPAPTALGNTVGLATEVRWTLPPGWRVVAERWPRPDRTVVGGDTTLTYAGRIEIEAVLDAPVGAAVGPVRARVGYGLCRDVCIPGWVTATLDP